MNMDNCNFKPFLTHINCSNNDFFAITSFPETETHTILSTFGLLLGKPTENFNICISHKIQYDFDHRLKTKSSLCSVPHFLSTHVDIRRKVHGERKVTVDMMRKVNSNTGIVLTIGTVICTNCRKKLTKTGKETEEIKEQMICTADEIMDCNLEHPSESTDISALSEDKCLLKNANIEGVQTRKRKLNYLSITTGVHSQNSDLDMSSQELSSQAT
ncbi:uncharacterized protein LOC134718829 isoform X1 [Mytilus trossulus]|uniref:uncharacterized protein LOC134718829 isoform X1 n=1 Tax=Mytilus trossulus TaxID=6551 RepID=UPI0030079963